MGRGRGCPGRARRESVDVGVAERTVAIRARNGGRRYCKVVGLPAGGRARARQSIVRGRALEIRPEKRETVKKGGGGWGLRGGCWPGC